MNIKKQLIFVILFILCASIVFSSSIYFSLQNYREAVKKTGISTQIVSLVFERRLVADDYLLYGGERAQQQWLAEQNSLNELIAFTEERVVDPQEKELVNLMKEKISISENVFQEIVEGRRNVATISAVLTDKDTRLASQLSRTAQETISAASELHELNDKNAEKNLQQILLLFSSAATMFSVLLFGSFWIIWRSANKLDQSNRRFELISKATRDVIYDWDLSKNKVWFNDSMQTLFGYSEDQIENNLDWLIEHIHPEDRKILTLDIEKILKENQTISVVEYRFRKSDGSYADVRDRGFVEKDNSGKHQRYLGSIQDISHDKELDRLKDEFLSVASHELRTPLTAIDGLVAMIREGEYGQVNKNLLEPLEDVNTSSERLIRLVNDLLNVSRIQAGRLKYTISDFFIQPVAKEVVDLLTPIAEEKGLKLQVGSEFKEGMVSADLDKVKQILNNLIGNSFKFTDKGSITVLSSEDSETVKIFVEDTGIGISVEDQQKLFGKFQQLESGKGRPAGTGLGLYLSLQMAKKMGGNLWLEKSEKGKGSTFAFSVPKAKSTLAEKIKSEIDIEAKSNPDQKA